MAHLPPASPHQGARVLDVGCGQGTQLVRLARSGYHVTGVDPSLELLDLAARSVDGEAPETRSRVVLRPGDIDGLDDFGSFDAVCCHGVVMYLRSLQHGLSRLCSAVAPGGLVSVLARNRANLVWRAALHQDWPAALAAFASRYYTNRLGIERVRADDPGEVISGLDDLGLDVVAWYGVRLWTDHWGDVPPPDDFDLVLEAEQLAGERDPYRQLCSLTHVLARRRPRP
jgi:SAM-dependent methyltransferase